MFLHLFRAFLKQLRKLHQIQVHGIEEEQKIKYEKSNENCKSEAKQNGQSGALVSIHSAEDQAMGRFLVKLYLKSSRWDN